MVVCIVANKVILFLIVFFELILCKRITPSSSIGGMNLKKLDECRRCKVLTDSFSHWLEKTSRGKYEGGDTAWEESKLKSYSRSEIRLIEIQEGLCSELKTHQDACYALAEDSEQVLERYWFHEDPNSVDLFTWFCIETLQNCCPINHFGDTCSPCPVNKYNKVCSGNGRCDGDGTRRGNGTCFCKRGYMGNICDECSRNFYTTKTGECHPCHESCNGCTSSGADSCQSCNSGWQLKSGVCIDIDECASSLCKSNQFCVNEEGSYSCQDCDMSCKSCHGPGSTNCTSCKFKFILWSGVCIDDDLKHSILISAFRRLALYIGLLVIIIFIFRHSRSIASLVISIVAIFIYFSEKTVNINLLDVILNLL